MLCHCCVTGLCHCYAAVLRNRAVSLCCVTANRAVSLCCVNATPLHCVSGLCHCAVSLCCVTLLCNSTVRLPAGVEPLSYYLLNGFLNFNVIFFLALLSLPVLVSAALVFCDLRVNTCPLSISKCQCCSSLAGDLCVSMCPLSVSKHRLATALL